MLDRSYLRLGLDALSRAHSLDYFSDGHRGAAIVAAYFMCREEPVEEAASECIASIIDEHWAATELCAPLPGAAPDPSLLTRFTDAVAANIGEMRMVGHNVIFPSLALKALREMPEAVTPPRVEGLCRLIEAFDTPMEIGRGGDECFPDLDTTPALAESILAEFARSAEAFVGRGQGWTGHMLTVGRAVVDLQALADILHRLGHLQRTDLDPGLRHVVDAGRIQHQDLAFTLAPRLLVKALARLLAQPPPAIARPASCSGVERDL